MAGYPNFTQALQDFGKVQVSDAKAGVGGTALESSIIYEVQGQAQFRPKLIFRMNDYGGFVDTGVKGTRNKRRQLNSITANELFGFHHQPAFTGTYKMINPSAIDKWVISKGLKGTRNAKGRFIKRSALKFAVATSIYRKGLEGTGFFSTPFESNMEAFTPVFEDALAKDLLKNITKKSNKYFV